MANAVSTITQAAAAPVRILFVEYDSDDIELCMRELRRSGMQFEPAFASTPEEFRRAAATQRFDVILASYRLPGWTGTDVLALARELELDIPFILVTGSLGEELALECIQKGVSDYVLKHQLPRLALAIRKSLDEKKLRDRQAHAEEALRDSEIHYRKLIESAPEAISVFDIDDATYVDVNQRFAVLLGLTRAELLTRAPWSVSPSRQPDGRLSRDAVQDYIARAFADGTIHFEWVYRHSLGADIPCEIFLSSVPEHSRRQVRASIIDITERKRAEAALRESELRYRSLFESATYGIFRVTAQGKILDANPALVSILGYASERQLLALDDTNIFYSDPDDRSRMRGQILRDGTGERIVDWIRRDGKTIKVRLVGHAADDPRAKGGCFEIIVEDVTDRLILEKQLRQAQKFEAFGQLAGGIAHDFNNMIGAILGWAEIGHDEAPPGSILRTRFDKIRLQADRAASLTRQLLAFARRQTLEPRHIQLNHIVTETLSLLEKIIGSNIEVQPVLAPDLAAVRADPTQFEQVLMNLCLNARDAMPDGGTLRVETRNVFFDEDFCRHNPHARPGPHVLLSVADSGHGMPPATLDRIFEPFFTTKGPSRGTGLGLATVYGVIKQHNGIVMVDSEVGKGTCFRLYLPATTEGAPPTAATGLVSEVLGGTETILVAEDHEGLRELARETLTALGYTVLIAADGEEAVALYRRHAHQIQLILLDVVLPKLNGPEIEAKIIDEGGNVPVIFASGYSPDIGIFQKIHPRPYPLLQKPYTPRDLARCVRDALDLHRESAK